MYQIRMWHLRSISNFSNAASDGNLVRVNEALDICNISDHFIRFFENPYTSSLIHVMHTIK